MGLSNSLAQYIVLPMENFVFQDPAFQDLKEDPTRPIQDPSSLVQILKALSFPMMEKARKVALLAIPFFQLTLCR